MGGTGVKNPGSIVTPAILCLAGLTLWFGILCGAARAEGKDVAFPEMDGWKQAGPPQLFSPETLYEYINGGADLYLKYEFQELKVAEYQNGKKGSVTVEVYQHRDPDHAFGIYSQERLSNANFLDIGAQGYSESAVLNFIKGPYYVKLSSDNGGADDQETLLAFARKLSQEMGGRDSLPGALSSFPPEGKKKNSEKFIAKDFLGYSFLHSGFTANYELSGKKYQLFVIEGESQNDCQAMLEKYLQQVDPSRKGAVEGPYRLKDPYHGELDLFWRGQSIWGTMSLGDPDLRAKYLKQFEEISRR
ncbi:MAG: hypothetical protein NTW68_08290 [candidate division NC10 bacterium]|nr:hypothetical protein [candidate division NC10 bacterium]